MLSNASMVMLLAKATIILVTALGITVVMQRASAGARHLVWLVTLGTLLMVPALAAWSPLRMEVLPPVVESSAATTVERESLGPAAASGPATAPATELPVAQYSAPESAASRLSALASLRGLYLLVGIWAAVVLALAAWLAWSALAVRRIVRRSHPLDTQDWMTPLWEIADRLELDEPPRLLGSDEAKMPFACGFIRSTIVLPANCETWTPDRRRAVLLHELAHVKRHDLVGHTLGRLTCALYWFHPLVWTAARRLRSESERACDDLALSCGAKASDYAEHLLDIVTSVRGDSTPAVALAMARRKEFEGRMLAILDPELRHSRPGRGQSAALIVSLALIAIVVGAAAPAPRPGSPVTLASQVAAAAPASAGAGEQVAPKDEVRSSPAETHQAAEAAVEKAAAPLLEEKGDDRGKVLSVEAQASAMIDAIAGTVASSVADAVTSSVGSVASKTSASVIEKLGAGFKEVATAPADERPALLANILRTDKDPSLRRIAAWGLAEHARHTVAIEALALAVRRDADPGVREMAAWALRDARRNSAGVVALSEALRSDQSEKVRATAAWSLGNIGDADAVGSITAALSDEARSVRHRAVWAIGRVEPKQAPPALIALLRDPEPAIRRVTAWALYRIEDPSTAGALNAALQAETNQNLRIDYIRALAALGEKNVDAVRGLLMSSDPQIKQMAVRALAGGHAAGPWPWPWPEPRPYP